jgi:hypothetical protein
MDDLAGLEAGFLLELAAGERQRIGVRLVFPGTLRQFPGAQADRIAILLYEMQPALGIERRHDGEIRLHHHAVDAGCAVAVADLVLAHPHPAIFVSDAGGKGLDVGACGHCDSCHFRQRRVRA